MMSEKKCYQKNKIPDSLKDVVTDCIFNGYIHELKPSGGRPKSFRHIAHYYLLKKVLKDGRASYLSILFSYGRVVGVSADGCMYAMERYTPSTREHLRSWAEALSNKTGIKYEVEVII